MGIARGKGFSASSKSLQIAVRDDEGYPMGLCPDPNNPTLNTVYGAHRLGLRTFEHPARETSEAFNREDGRVKQRIKLGISSDGDGGFEVGTEDENWNLYLRGGGYDDTLSDEMLFMAGNRTEVSNKTYFLMPGTLFQKDDFSMWYKYFIYLNNQVEEGAPPNVNQDDGENPNPLNYTFTPNSADRLITGTPFSTTDMVVYDNKDIFTQMRCRYEVHQATWIANGTAVFFDLPYLPVFSAVTVGGANIICKNGVPTAVTTVSTTTGRVTIAAAGVSGDKWTVFYPTRWRTA